VLVVLMAWSVTYTFVFTDYQSLVDSNFDRLTYFVSASGVCSNCIAIAEDRHVDVIEMDAASNTGVDNMRDLIDSVQYAPMLAEVSWKLKLLRLVLP
jgi:hypothetical protein